MVYIDASMAFFTRSTIIVLVLALLAFPLGFIELAFGHKFSSFLWMKGWGERLHTLWCYYANSRYGFVFGALAWIVWPPLFIISAAFSYGMMLAQVLLGWRNQDRVKLQKIMEEERRASKRYGSVFKGRAPDILRRPEIDTDRSPSPPGNLARGYSDPYAEGGIPPPPLTNQS